MASTNLENERAAIDIDEPTSAVPNPTCTFGDEIVQVLHIKFGLTKGSQQDRITMECTNGEALRACQDNDRPQPAADLLGVPTSNGRRENVQVDKEYKALHKKSADRIRATVNRVKTRLELDGVNLNPNKDVLFLENLCSLVTIPMHDRGNNSASLWRKGNMETVFHYLSTFSHIMIPRHEFALWKDRAEEAACGRPAYETFHRLTPVILGPFGKPHTVPRRLTVLLDPATPGPQHDWSKVKFATEVDPLHEILSAFPYPRPAGVQGSLLQVGTKLDDLKIWRYWCPALPEDFEDRAKHQQRRIKEGLPQKLYFAMST